jgi:hypothetical protein
VINLEKEVKLSAWGTRGSPADGGGRIEARYSDGSEFYYYRSDATVNPYDRRQLMGVETAARL